jgi:hypothetical protein
VAQSARRTLSVASRWFKRQAIGSEDNAVKRAIIACTLLFVGTFAAQAYHFDDTYYDLMRPNGKARSDAVFDADLNACYRQTGASRYALGDAPAFKQCMLGRKWRWQSVRTVRSPSKGRPDCFDLMFNCGFSNNPQ